MEVSFEGHYPVERKNLNISFTERASFDFEGIGFAINGSWFGDVSDYKDDGFIFNVEMYIDDKLEEVVEMPIQSNTRRYPPFWKYQLPMGKHNVHFKVLNPIDGVELRLDDAIIYSNNPSKVPDP